MIPALDPATTYLRAPAMPEGRLLRRADWRVLLPIPPLGFEHLVLLGGPPGLGELLVEIGVARRVSGEIPARARADAVAILRGARAGCEEAAAALAPGGCLYWEVEAGRWGIRRRRIETRLLRAGLSATGIYAVLPDFERSELYLPAAARIVRWHLSQWRPLVLRRLWASPVGTAAAALVLRRWLRHAAVTAVAGPGGESLPSILAHPALSGRTVGLPLVVNREQADATRRVIVFAFSRGSARPCAVLKFWRLPWRNAEIQREQELVAALRSRLASPVWESIPEPMGAWRWGRIVVGAEACVPGRPLSREAARRKSRAKDLRLAALWLRAFHRQTAGRTEPWIEPRLQEVVEEPLASYEAAFGLSVEEADLFDRVRRRARSLLGGSLPLVFAHPAFSEFNICVDRDRVSVIDWEGTQPGAPLHDLIYFVTLWYYRAWPQRSRRAQIDAFRGLFVPAAPDPLGTLAFTAFQQYMDDLGIDPRFFPIFLVLTWVVHAVARFRRARATKEEGADPRRGNLHVERVQVLAESRDLLLPEPRC